MTADSTVTVSAADLIFHRPEQFGEPPRPDPDRYVLWLPTGHGRECTPRVAVHVNHDGTSP